MSDEKPNVLTGHERTAIEQFLEYAEGEYGKSQQGYFSGGGWAACQLRGLLARTHDPNASIRSTAPSDT